MKKQRDFDIAFSAIWNTRALCALFVWNMQILLKALLCKLDARTETRENLAVWKNFFVQNEQKWKFVEQNSHGTSGRKSGAPLKKRVNGFLWFAPQHDLTFLSIILSFSFQNNFLSNVLDVALFAVTTTPRWDVCGEWRLAQVLFLLFGYFCTVVHLQLAQYKYVIELFCSRYMLISMLSFKLL